MDSVTHSVAGGIARICLNRPDRLNALDADLASALHLALRSAANDERVSCVILEGAGGNFMAGGDIGYFASHIDDDRAAMPDEVFAAAHGAVETIAAMPKPVIASVAGACAGYGVSLVAACDLSIASANAVFTLAYCHLGVSPDGGSTWHLPRQLGSKKASELAFFGEHFDAPQALSFGLLNRVVDDGHLARATLDWAERMVDGPRYAIARSKGLLRQSFDTSLSEQLNMEQAAFLDCTQRADFVEGVRAFLQKRTPSFNNNE